MVVSKQRSSVRGFRGHLFGGLPFQQPLGLDISHQKQQNITSVYSGPGDLIAVMGLAVSLKVDLYWYVPPHNDTEKWASNLAYKCMQYHCAVQIRLKPCILLVIRGGHFKALSTPSTAIKKAQGHSVLDLFKPDTDAATSKYEFSPLFHRYRFDRYRYD